MKSVYLVLGLSALALSGLGFAQEKSAKKAAAGGAKNSPAAVARGKEVFDKKCAVCHYPESDAKKITANDNWHEPSRFAERSHQLSWRELLTGSG